jgi:hypothetical protein
VAEERLREAQRRRNEVEEELTEELTEEITDEIDREIYEELGIEWPAGRRRLRATWTLDAQQILI